MVLDIEENWADALNGIGAGHAESARMKRAGADVSSSAVVVYELYEAEVLEIPHLSSLAQMHRGLCLLCLCLGFGMAFSGTFKRCRALLEEHGVSVTDPVADSDPKGAAYDAYSLQVGGKQCAYRTAKITPTKNGAFVTCWKRPDGGAIVPLTAEDLHTLFVAVEEAGNFGMFVFPAQDLLSKGILSGGKKGSSVVRVAGLFNFWFRMFCSFSLTVFISWCKSEN